MRVRSFNVVLVATVLTAATAQADNAAAPVPDTAAKISSGTPEPTTISRIRDIVANTKDAADVFFVRDDGKIYHIQSGLDCPAEFPNVEFRHAQIYPSALGVGMDVGCDYGRSDANRGTISKLTIFATKAAENTSLDQAFTQYQADIRKTFPDVHPTGPALVMEQKGNAKLPFPDFRSEAYDLTIDGAPYHSELIVSVQGGWIIEIRTTYSTQISADATPDEMGRAVMDAGGSSLAFLAASGSVGK